MSARLATSAAPRISSVAPGRPAAGVGAQHDVGVQHRDQPVEVAVARGGEEGVDDLALPAPGRRRGAGALAPHAAAGAAGQLAGRVGRAVRRSARSPRTAPRTCRAGRRPAARPGRASPAPPAAPGRPSRPAAPRARGSIPPTGLDDRVGHVRASSGSSRRAVRERSMFRHTRATTVVSQPPRFSTSLASDAAQPQPGVLHGVVGLGERAEHPVGHRPQPRPVLLEAARPATPARPWSRPHLAMVIQPPRPAAGA